MKYFDLTCFIIILIISSSFSIHLSIPKNLSTFNFTVKYINSTDTKNNTIPSSFTFTVPAMFSKNSSNHSIIPIEEENDTPALMSNETMKSMIETVFPLSSKEERPIINLYMNGSILINIIQNNSNPSIENSKIFNSNEKENNGTNLK